jgi:hypothetical protein
MSVFAICVILWKNNDLSYQEFLQRSVDAGAFWAFSHLTSGYEGTSINDSLEN